MNDQEVIMNSFKHFSGTEIGPFRIYSDHKYGPYYMVHSKLPYKVGCVFPVAVISILPQAESGPYDHREDTPHFTRVLQSEHHWPAEFQKNILVRNLIFRDFLDQ